jgi:hypothetical protein
MKTKYRMKYKRNTMKLKINVLKYTNKNVKNALNKKLNKLIKKSD